MIDQLKQFDAIAWDFDGTLIDHPKAPLMHRFINDHPEKTHVIVTFRTHGLQHRIFEELSRYRSAPGKDQFSGVYNVSDRAWQRFTNTQYERKAGLRDGPPTPWELYYVNWKGLVCKLRNLPVIIDDKPSDVVPGCERYGIVFVHPDSL
jgi:hypothetical protein